MTATGTFDFIVIGAGHNGLITASYLARTGASVLVLERRLEAGGGLTTEEFTRGGFLHNLHSFFHDTIDVMPPYRDLKLADHGARYVCPEVQVGVPLRDGRGFTIHNDAAATERSIARVSAADAVAYAEMRDGYREFMETIVVPGLYSAPPPPSHVAGALETSPEGADYLRLSRSTPADVVRETFENEAVRAGVLFQLAVPRGILPDYAGLGMVVPLVVSQIERSQISVGGSHALAHAIWRAFVSAGGVLRGMAEVTKIEIDGNRARGVYLANGEWYEAKRAVISATGLRQTFKQFVGLDKLDAKLARRLLNFKLDEFSLFGVHLALREAPRFSAAAFDPDIDRALKLDLGFETPADFADALAAIRKRRIPDHTGLYAAFPSLHDPSQAPAGFHTGLLWTPVPFHLDGVPGETDFDKWEHVKRDVLLRCLATLRAYAPNMTSDAILAARALTPADIPLKFPNMCRGGVFMGRLSQDQIEFFRPLPELSQHRTPIDALYLAGSFCHPGGGITGAPGYIAAQVIADDLGLTKWWEHA
jgi:phytoene dehydrogenase-like protein